VPTFEHLALFKREYRKLTPEQKARFQVAVNKRGASLKQTPPTVPGGSLVHPLMLTPGERSGPSSRGRRKRRLEHVAPEVRWTVERLKRNGRRRAGEGPSRRRHRKLAAPPRTSRTTRRSTVVQI
jgi:hypothetical protein